MFNILNIFVRNGNEHASSFVRWNNADCIVPDHQVTRSWHHSWFPRFASIAHMLFMAIEFFQELFATEQTVRMEMPDESIPLDKMWQLCQIGKHLNCMCHSQVMSWHSLILAQENRMKYEQWTWRTYQISFSIAENSATVTESYLFIPFLNVRLYFICLIAFRKEHTEEAYNLVEVFIMTKFLLCSYAVEM